MTSSMFVLYLTGGCCAMTRKDSEFPELWNYGYNKILMNGVFKNLCERGNIIHGKVTYDGKTKTLFYWSIQKYTEFA